MDGSARIVDMLQVFHIRSGALHKRVYYLQISLCLKLEGTCAFTKYRINIKTQLTLTLMGLTIARRIKPEMLVQV